MRHIVKQVHIICMILFPVTINAQTHPTLENTIICGYQGWFACYGDKSPVERWNHWCSGTYHSEIPKPSPGNQKFELYPDISEYKSDELFQTGYESLGDGRSAKLFSSYPESTIDLHFQWMKDAGIDGAALQRFLGETKDAVYKAHRDSIAVRMMRAAEKHNRVFYIMYDGVGNQIDNLIDDWENHMVGKLKVTSSPRYAFMNGKPVVCIWGFGFTHYKDVASEALRAITKLKDDGYYVIGGTPTNWHTGTSDSKADYAAVYAAYDMISPWTPGRYKQDKEVDNYKTNFLKKDQAKLDSLGIAYQPVIFPGFAWSNWNGGAKNDFPRRQGAFMWRQFYNIQSLGIKQVYVAMFDEYDEGTAIAKAAVDYFDVPIDQYFQTLSIDGVFVSSDFYLRLAGAASQVLKGNRENTISVPVPLSIGPLFFRSGFEPVDAQLSWVNQPDSGASSIKNITGPAGSGLPVCAVTQGVAKMGSNMLQFSGMVSSPNHSFAYHKSFDVDIPVSETMVFSYDMNPQTALGRYVTLDLAMKDGTTLRSSAAVDITGAGMQPASGQGVMKQWTLIRCNIGKWFEGNTIDRILVSFEHTGDSGPVQAYFDNVSIYTESQTETKHKVFNTTPEQTPEFRYSNGIIRYSKGSENTQQVKSIELFTVSGRRIAKVKGYSTDIHGKIPPGTYFLRIKFDKNDKMTRKETLQKMIPVFLSPNR